MEVQVIRYTFKGSTEEYQTVRSLFEQEVPSTSIVDQEPAATVEITPEVQQKEVRLTKDEIRQVLTRRPKLETDHNHRKLFKILDEDKGEWVHASTLVSKLGFGDEKAKLAGVLGALGRRINQTPNISQAAPPQTALELFIDVRRSGKEWYYRMRPELREVLAEMDYL